MMNVTLDKKDSTFGNLKVVLTEADYKSKVDKKIKDYAKKAVIKGFRPGMAPISLINKLYGKSLLVDEIFKLADESITNYLKESKLSIVGRPLPSEDQKQIDFEKDKEFEFTYDLGLVPDFNYALPTSHEVVTIELSDKIVNETLDNLKKQYGKMTNPEKSEDEDFLFGRAKMEGQEADVYASIPLTKVAKGELVQFIGLKADDVVKFDIRAAFANDNANISYLLGITLEEAEKVSGTCEFKLEKISRSAIADLDQEFFDKVFGKDTVKSEEEFMAKLKEILGGNYKQESELFNKFSLKSKVLNETQLSLSKDFVKRWIEHATEGKTTKEDVEKEYNNYENEMKWMYIVDKIATEKEIKVETTEVLAKTKLMLGAQFGNMPMNEEMDKYLDTWADNYLKENKGRNFLSMYDQTLNDKVLNNIYDNVNKTVKTVTSEEFKTLVESK